MCILTRKVPAVTFDCWAKLVYTHARLGLVVHSSETESGTIEVNGMPLSTQLQNHRHRLSQRQNEDGSASAVDARVERGLGPCGQTVFCVCTLFAPRWAPVDFPLAFRLLPRRAAFGTVSAIALIIWFTTLGLTTCYPRASGPC